MSCDNTVFGSGFGLPDLGVWNLKVRCPKYTGSGTLRRVREKRLRYPNSICWVWVQGSVVHSQFAECGVRNPHAISECTSRPPYLRMRRKLFTSFSACGAKFSARFSACGANFSACVYSNTHAEVKKCNSQLRYKAVESSTQILEMFVSAKFNTIDLQNVHSVIHPFAEA